MYCNQSIPPLTLNTISIVFETVSSVYALAYQDCTSQFIIIHANLLSLDKIKRKFLCVKMEYMSTESSTIFTTTSCSWKYLHFVTFCLRYIPYPLKTNTYHLYIDAFSKNTIIFHILQEFFFFTRFLLWLYHPIMENFRFE